jgi:methionyl-tRNA formyltransferase
VAVTDGFINILSLQLSGKKRMNTRDFLNGAKIGGDWKMK